jgi:hypothetical protein
LAGLQENTLPTAGVSVEKLPSPRGIASRVTLPGIAQTLVIDELADVLSVGVVVGVAVGVVTEVQPTRRKTAALMPRRGEMREVLIAKIIERSRS